ncbi:STAS domain-containing protein [Rufibacter sp. DG15C]|uniref:STAS domain-containing protein n=1 Tax=Rufibacter sp. DG15C TaxID=1379909 RepID=UPI001E4E8226|nr:STAS domain-containing protein [Rufibacter sp. DG15C]
MQATYLADHTPLVILQGSLDEAYAGTLLNVLHEATPWKSPFILVDFGKIIQVSPTGLRLLLPLISHLQAQKKNLVLFNLRKDIHEVVSSSGFDSLVVIKPTFQDALQYVQLPPKFA